MFPPLANVGDYVAESLLNWGAAVLRPCLDLAGYWVLGRFRYFS